MALCRTCSAPIPCHCHLTPAIQIRPGVYWTPDRPPSIKRPAQK